MLARKVKERSGISNERPSPEQQTSEEDKTQYLFDGLQASKVEEIKREEKMKYFKYIYILYSTSEITRR